MSKLIYVDTETGGLNHRVNPILQLSGIIEIDDKEVDRFDYKIIPSIKRYKVEDEALAVTGTKREDISFYNNYISSESAYFKFVNLLNKYRKDDYSDRFYMVGYNSHYFDSNFIRTFLGDNNDTFSRLFYNPSIDVMLVAAFACIGQRNKLPRFNLMTVAKSLGIEVDENKLHDAMYDVEITRKIFKILKMNLNS